MKHIKQMIEDEDKPVVHYDSPHVEFALCGDQIIEDDAGMSIGVETKEPVNCRSCLDIVRHVRGK